MARSSQVWAGRTWCAAAISSPFRAPSRAPVPKVSLGHVRLFLVLCLSERVILVKEEGEKGNKMAFGQGNDRKCSPPRSGFG